MPAHDLSQPDGTPVGCYIHIPFCRSKCPYCDFYSLRGDAALHARYADCVAQRLREAADVGWRWSSIYVGGGTPSALALAALDLILSAALEGRKGDDAFTGERVQDEFTGERVQGEFTVECNPGDVTPELCALLAARGVNRVSLGLQSADDAERRALGRRSGAEQARLAIDLLRAKGIENISIDVMLGIPRQTKESLRQTLAFCAEAGATHISAYLLKLEPGTSFSQRPPQALPDEDEQCALYLAACGWLEDYGYRQYEIANFCQPGRESRHNLLYWNAEPYYAVGPGSHGFTGGQRWFYERNLEGFLAGAKSLAEGPGGDLAEYVMLRLRLTEGLREELLTARFGHIIPPALRRAAQPLERLGLVREDAGGVALTREGFLLSNRVIGQLLEAI